MQVYPGITPFLYNHKFCCQGNHAISHNQNIFLFKDNCFCTQVVSLNKLAHTRNELSWEFNLGIIIPWELVYQMFFCLKFCFVSFLLNFGHVGTEPWLPWFYQYFFGVNVSCSRTQHGNPSEDRTPTLSLTTKSIRKF